MEGSIVSHQHQADRECVSCNQAVEICEGSSTALEFRAHLSAHGSHFDR